MNVYLVRAVCEVTTKSGQLKQVYPCVDRSTMRAFDFIENANGKPYKKPWRAPKFALDKPRLKRADFLDLNWRVFACNQRAMAIVGDLLRASGQLFPANVKGEKEEYQVCNPTRLLRGAFDAKGAQYVVLPTHKVMTAPAFHANKIPANVSLFKVPQGNGHRIYCVEHTGNAEDGEFKALVEKHSLTGLEFKLMWSDGKGTTKQKATKAKTTVIKPPAEKKSTGSDRPLKASEKKDVALSIKRGYEQLKLKPSTPSRKAQEAIRTLVDSVVAGKAKLNSSALADAAVNVGCLWGQSVCDATGWEWCFAKVGGKSLLAIAPKNRAYVVAPMHFIQAQLKKRRPADNTSLLLFNMIKSGKSLPAAKAKAYVHVG